MRHLRFHILLALLLAVLTGNVKAVEPDTDEAKKAPKEMSADEVARELANPNTPLAKLTLKNQWTSWDGDLNGADGRDSGTFQFQPAFPFPVGERKNIFFRPSLIYMANQPVVNPATGQVSTESGFADIGYDVAYGYATKSGWQMVGGMIGSFPTGSSEFSSDTWTLGPEAAVAKLAKWGVYAISTNHSWDISGPQKYSLTTIQPVLVFLLGGGWTTGTAPSMKYDWEGDQWTVPLNLLLSRTVKLGKRPWRFGIEANYYIERSDRLGPKWMFGFNITPVLPNIFAKWLGL